MNKQFYVGCGKEIITPPLNTLLYGYSDKRPASSVLDDLTVNAIAFKQADINGIMISADICSITKETVEKIRETIFKETGVPKDNISFSCTHTHSGPAIKGSGGWGVPNMEYIDNILIPQTVKSAKKAVSTLTPAQMGVSKVNSLVGINRREYRLDGTIKLGQNPSGVQDNVMTVISFRSLTGENIVNMIHYSCHGTSAGRTTDITRDWPGFMVDELQEISGAQSVFFNGSEGDVGPRLSNNETTGDTFDKNERPIASTNKYIKEIGSLAAIDAVRAFRDIKEYRDVDFNIIKGEIALPYKPIPTLEEAQEKLEKLGAPENLFEVEKREYQALQDTIKLHKANFKFEKEMKFNQVMFAFNSTIFVPFPFEVFSQIALRLRKFSPYENTLCLCNTNDSLFYLPSQEEIARGGYEIEVFLYANVNKLKNNTDDTIILENLRLMNEYNK